MVRFGWKWHSTHGKLLLQKLEHLNAGYSIISLFVLAVFMRNVSTHTRNTNPFTIFFFLLPFFLLFSLHCNLQIIYTVKPICVVFNNNIIASAFHNRIILIFQFDYHVKEENQIRAESTAAIYKVMKMCSECGGYKKKKQNNRSTQLKHRNK